MKKFVLALRELSILFAEDEDATREAMTDTLKIFFKNVITCKDGLEALENFMKQKPKIVFTDIRMPNMDGLELLEEIRKIDQHTPVMLFTAHNESRYLTKAINLQVQGFISKNSSLDDMLKIFLSCAQRLFDKEPMIIELQDGIKYIPATNEVIKEYRKISLSPKEHSVMNELLNKYPNFVNKEDLSNSVWPMEAISEVTIKNTISRLRQKVGHKSIVNIAGMGWRVDVCK